MSKEKPKWDDFETTLKQLKLEISKSFRTVICEIYELQVVAMSLLTPYLKIAITTIKELRLWSLLMSDLQIRAY